MIARRTAAYAALLVALYILASVNDDLFVILVTAASVVIPAFHFATWLLLRWASHEAPDVEALRERMNDAYTLWIISSAGGIAGAISLLRVMGVQIEGRPVLVLLGFVLVMLVVPALDWLTTFRDTWLPMIKRRG